MSDTEKRTASKFTTYLGKMVQMQYCIGGCSTDEIRMATAEFLMNLADEIIGSIESACEVPPAR